jgi:HEAT repeat protein
MTDDDRIHQLIARTADAEGFAAEPTIRELASFAERAVGPIIQAFRTARNHNMAENLIFALREIRTPAVEPLLEELQSADPNRLLLAIFVLEYVRDTRAEPYLRRLVEHSDPLSRREAKFALAKLTSSKRTGHAKEH